MTTSKFRVTGFCARNSPGLVNSPHKWPVKWKCFHLMTSSWKMHFEMSSGKWRHFVLTSICVTHKAPVMAGSHVVPDTVAGFGMLGGHWGWLNLSGGTVAMVIGTFISKHFAKPEGLASIWNKVLQWRHMSIIASLTTDNSIFFEQ